MINVEDLDLVESYDSPKRDQRDQGVYLNENDTVYIDVGAGEPRRATLRYALEWMADHHDVDELNSTHNLQRFFRLLAAKLPEGV